MSLMSHPTDPSGGTAHLPLQSSIAQDFHTECKVDCVFEQYTPNQAISSSSNEAEAFDKFYSAINCGSVPHGTYSECSTLSSPDLPRYDCDQLPFSYHHPSAVTPHEYEVEHVRLSSSNINTYFDQSPLPFRTHKGSSPSPLPRLASQDYVRRRSLSHNDVDHLATVPLNLTFVRSQVARANSNTLEERSRSSPYSKHGRSTSYGPGSRGRKRKTPIPQTPQRSPLAGGIMLTSLGTPIDEYIGMDRSIHQSDIHPSNSLSHKPAPLTYTNDPQIRRMVDPNQLAHSKRIIQIGAMASREQRQMDPRLDDKTAPTTPKSIFTKLGEVEEFLKRNEAEHKEALNGCILIRDALANRVKVTNMVIEIEGDEVDGLVDTIKRT